MALLTNFNAAEIEPQAPMDPIPAGKYLAAIVESESKPTKNGQGEYIELRLQVLEGPCKGRSVWARLCIKHPNPETVRIARSQLATICRSVNVLQPRDTMELHNIPLVVTVRTKTRADTGEQVNEVSGFAAKAAAPAVGQPQQQYTPSTAGTGAAYAGTTPPWKRSPTPGAGAATPGAGAGASA